MLGTDAVRRPLPFAISAGSLAISLSGVATAAGSVTFGVATRFTQGPLIVATENNSPGGSQKFIVRYTASSTTGATFNVYTGDGTTATANCGISYIAIQMTSAAAANN